MLHLVDDYWSTAEIIYFPLPSLYSLLLSSLKEVLTGISGAISYLPHQLSYTRHTNYLFTAGEKRNNSLLCSFFTPTRQQNTAFSHTAHSLEKSYVFYILITFIWSHLLYMFVHMWRRWIRDREGVIEACNWSWSWVGGAWKYHVLTFELLVGPRGRDLSIISLSFSLSHTDTLLSHAHTHTNTHSHTCWWGLRLGDECCHGRVGVQPVTEHVGGSQVEDWPRQTTHLKTEAQIEKCISHKQPHTHTHTGVLGHFFIFYWTVDEKRRTKMRVREKYNMQQRSVPHCDHSSLLLWLSGFNKELGNDKLIL